jgi:hypothetical protein
MVLPHHINVLIRSPPVFLTSAFSGKPLTLPCRVQFGFQRLSKPVIKWYVKESTQEWEMSVFEEKR